MDLGMACLAHVTLLLTHARQAITIKIEDQSSLRIHIRPAAVNIFLSTVEIHPGFCKLQQMHSKHATDCRVAADFHTHPPPPPLSVLAKTFGP